MKEELLNFLINKELSHQIMSERLLDAIVEFIELKFNDSSAQIETPSVGNKKGKKENLCQCEEPEYAYIASNFCKRCSKHTY